MTELPRHPDSDDGAPLDVDREPTASAPRGPYVFAAIVVIAVLVVVVLHLTGVVGPGAH